MIGFSLSLSVAAARVPGGASASPRLAPQADGANIGTAANTYFAAGHGWTIQAGGTGSTGNPNNTSTFNRGTQCLSFTTGSTTTAKTCRVSGLALNLQGKRLQVLLRVSNVPKIASAGLSIDIFTGGGFTNGRRCTLIGSLTGQGERSIPSDRWTLVDVPLSGAHTSAIGTGPGDLSSITNIQLRAVSSDGTDVTVYWQMVAVLTPPATSTVLVTFDDGRASTHSLAYPIMQALGIPGTNYLIRNYVDNLAGYMTRAQLAELAGAGWSNCAQANAATVLNWEEQTGPALLADLTACRDWLYRNGWHPNHGAYQEGEFWGGGTGSDGTQANEVLTTLGDGTPNPFFSTCRTINRYIRGSWPPPEPLRVAGVDWLASDTPAGILALLDEDISNKGTTFLVFHEIVAAGATNDQITTADFTTIMNGIATRRDAGNLLVRTAQTVGT